MSLPYFTKIYPNFFGGNQKKPDLPKTVMPGEIQALLFNGLFIEITFPFLA